MTKLERFFRVGADIGGTFTDVVFLENDEKIHIKKCSSTPSDYSIGVINGVTALLRELDGTPDQITEVVHATTVATNTILEGKGAVTALVTTKGFRDVIEIGRLRVPELYNLNYEKPRPLAPRRRRYEIGERLAADGSVVRPLDEQEVCAVARHIKRDAAQAVAISFIHSYANPEHEARVAAILRQELGDTVFVTSSTEVLPEIREYERTSTVVVNAYLGPVVEAYLRSLQAGLRAAGVEAPLQIMQSSGGVMNAASAMAKPACIIESGPAAGVIAAAQIGAAANYSELITIDMGGTTAKAAIVEKGEPARTTEYEVGAGINLSSKLIKGGGHAVKMPFIDVSEIGAGGGSVVRIDDGGLIQVGPDSAGSTPGPACYAAGGEEPTLTDAMLILGYLNPHYIAGGAVILDASLSTLALESQIAKPAGIDRLTAAYGVYSIAASTMMRAVKAVSTYRGRDPREFTLFAFGGNGPLIANEIASLLDIPRIVVPPSPGVFSALGLLFSSTQREELRTLYHPVEQLTPSMLRDNLAEIEELAKSALLDEGYPAEDIYVTRHADLRYSGQAFELQVEVTLSPNGDPDIPALVRRFHNEHEKTYGHGAHLNSVELVTLRVVGRSRSQEARKYSAPPVRDRPIVDGFAASEERIAYFGPNCGALRTPVVSRLALVSNSRKGPLIVEEYDSTCVVQPGWKVSLDKFGNIVIEKELN